MATSGTYDFGMSNSSVLLEAFDRCKIRPTAVTRDQILSGGRSMNLELISWANRGVNLWKVESFTIQLVAGQAAYTAGAGVTNIPARTISFLDVYYSLLNAGGAGINIDRIMIPMSRSVYDELSNKLQPGVPTMYWFNKLLSPTLTLYQPPLQGYPTAQISGHLLSRLQDSNLGGAQNPDVDTLALDALCAGLARRLGTKFVDDQKHQMRLDTEAKEAWTLFSDTNREEAPISIVPDWGNYTMGS